MYIYTYMGMQVHLHVQVYTYRDRERKREGKRETERATERGKERDRESDRSERNWRPRIQNLSWLLGSSTVDPPGIRPETQLSLVSVASGNLEYGHGRIYDGFPSFPALRVGGWSYSNFVASTVVL